MKLVTKEKEPAFTPFDITLRVETAEEARLLWHVFNRSRLKEAIFDSTYICADKYNKDIADMFSGGDEEVRSFIKERVSIEI